jgi:hypothetical protein
MHSYDLEYFRMARELNVKFYDRLKNKNLHCRGSLNSTSLISLDTKTPERGISNITKEEKFLSILKDIESGKIKIEKPNRNTPEKLLQATIISHSIYKNNHYLPFGGEIRFITSEFALKNDEQKVVNDILGFSNDGALYVIELKSSRLKTELQNQVKTFERFIINHVELFSDLLKIHGPNWDKQNIKKAVVWPRSKSSSKKVFDTSIEEFVYDKELLENEGILVIEELKNL